MMEDKVDVLISGAGPVGLLIALQLRRLGVSTYILDAADKASPDFPMYGRACTLFPRTLEMLDQLDLFEEMSQQGFIGCRSMTYRNGALVHGRGWSAPNNIHNTLFPFWLNLRLKYSEDIFRARLARLGSKVQAPVKLVKFELDEHAADDYKVTSTCARLDGVASEIKSKYIIGCDGAGSAVRKLAGIPFDGAEKEDHWVRIDGVVKTNMPDPRAGVSSIESPTHGNVLWVALDHGATRIGYVLTAEMAAKYGRHMKQEDAIREAQAAVAPYELEFKKVDWHTVYIVKQFVATRFQDRERILLAGDSAHSHSSATAQGMNTGTHDAVSLAWRVAGVLQGKYRPEVLENYSVERRAIAQHLIENDKTAAALIAQKKPEKLKDRPEDPNVLFHEFLSAEAEFSMGLGVIYPPNLLNDLEGSVPVVGVRPGFPFPDAVLHKQGFQKAPHAVRLHEVTKYNGNFHVLVFTGHVQHTGPQLAKLRQDVDKNSASFDHAVEFRTIVCGSGKAYAEFLGVQPFGWAYWDTDGTAHDRYNISVESGAIAVLRPDGILGFAGRLDAFEKVVAYLDRLVVPTQVQIHTNGTSGGDIGRMMVPDENNLYYRASNAEDVPDSLEQGAVGSHAAQAIGSDPR